MAVLQTRKLSNRTMEALSVDRELTGFRVRVCSTGGKIFVAQAQGPDGTGRPHKPRRITAGRHPVLGAEQARQSSRAHHRAGQRRGGAGAPPSCKAPTLPFRS